MPELKPGFGMEFLEIAELDDFISFLEELSSPAYIPAG